jgi:hypothetical protein
VTVSDNHASLLQKCNLPTKDFFNGSWLLLLSEQAAALSLKNKQFFIVICLLILFEKYIFLCKKSTV